MSDITRAIFASKSSSWYYVVSKSQAKMAFTCNVCHGLRMYHDSVPTFIPALAISLSFSDVYMSVDKRSSFETSIFMISKFQILMFISRCYLNR